MFVNTHPLYLFSDHLSSPANAPERWEYSTVYSGSKRSFDATAPGSICVQGGGTAESEDCLFANVFTPYLPANSGHKALKPVMFW